MEEGYSYIQATAARGFNGNIQYGSGGGVGGGKNGGGTKCGRWNPTVEQVKVLTELFRAGLRTPSTDQIQKISTQLSFYGKIESKNVFYWFQNHKARERQKRRRVSTTSSKDDDRFALSQHNNDKSANPTTPKYFGELNQATLIPTETEEVTETLQLFPLSSSCNDDEQPRAWKSRALTNYDYKENTTPSFNFSVNGREVMSHPPLDLRLSFL